MFTVEFLNELRAAEIEKIVTCFPSGARVLEIGAGTGRQAAEIRRRGFDVEAIEIPDSNYKHDRLFPITDYDGRRIPFPDATFDVVFSSNVLEHVRDLDNLHGEIKRVIRSGGTCVHVLPTHAWRFWTTLAAFPAALQQVATLKSRLGPRRPGKLGQVRRLLGVFFRGIGYLLAPFFQGRHGERGNIVTEIWLFHPRRWRRNFKKNGFEIVRDQPMDLHYTGHLVYGARRSVAQRARMAKRLGSACHLFQLRIASR